MVGYPETSIDLIYLIIRINANLMETDFQVKEIRQHFKMEEINVTFTEEQNLLRQQEQS